MVETDIIDDILYLVVDTEVEVLEWFPSSEATKWKDKLKAEIVYRNEVH